MQMQQSVWLAPCFRSHSPLLPHHYFTPAACWLLFPAKKRNRKELAWAINSNSIIHCKYLRKALHMTIFGYWCFQKVMNKQQQIMGVVVFFKNLSKCFISYPPFAFFNSTFQPILHSITYVELPCRQIWKGNSRRSTPSSRVSIHTTTSIRTNRVVALGAAISDNDLK
jgi:hypothetical protein